MNLQEIIMEEMKKRENQIRILLNIISITSILNGEDQ